MKIIAFKIEKTINIPFQTQAATLDEMTRELPDGFYTTFSTIFHGTKVLGLHKHLERLYVPAAAQRINPAVDALTLRTRIAEFAKINLPSESRIRLILTKNDGTLYVGVQPFQSLANEIYNSGVKVITSELTRESPRVKDTGFISSSIEQRKQLSEDVFEILLVKNGKILEGMTSNFFAIKGKTLVTAQSGILLGVTRRVILRLARGQGMSVDYRAPNIAPREKFDEAFLSSSSRGIVPIVSIDNGPVGQGRPGKWTRLLSKEYQVYVEEKGEKIIESL